MSDIVSRNLSPKQMIAITCLLAGEQIKRTATIVGVTEKTLHRWLADPDFQSALRDAEIDAMKHFSRGLLSMSDLALAAIRDGLSPNEKMTYRLRAADIWSDRLIRLYELMSVEQRLESLERQLLDADTVEELPSPQRESLFPHD